MIPAAFRSAGLNPAARKSAADKPAFFNSLAEYPAAFNAAASQPLTRTISAAETPFFLNLAISSGTQPAFRRSSTVTPSGSPLAASTSLSGNPAPFSSPCEKPAKAICFALNSAPRNSQAENPQRLNFSILKSTAFMLLALNPAFFNSGQVHTVISSLSVKPFSRNTPQSHARFKSSSCAP